MGLPRLLGFKKARKYLQEKDFVNCADELLDSKLGRSPVKGIVKRITELSNRMREV